MLSTFTRDQLTRLGPTDLSDELEFGRIVHFPECPVELPSPEDLAFLREEMPKRLKLKNVSYHPEADRIFGIRGDRQVVERTHRILKGHSARVQEFLRRVIPTLARGWRPGTSSFRPLQERGRNLSRHASNELVHVDAGAYGATHGDRVLRFFVNVNPSEDRIWTSKGALPELYERYGRQAGLVPPDGAAPRLEEGFLDRLRTAAVRTLSAVIPTVRLLDSSPYDRAMRRFHNFMKDTPEFQSAPEGHREFAFKPFSAWMVFTDMVSHACISGQHAFIDTFIIPLANCRRPELAPINILRRR
ncbi:MAG: Kdo hydroxylase family protein [Planctomycetota bacterium]